MPSERPTQRRQASLWLPLRVLEISTKVGASVFSCIANRFCTVVHAVGGIIIDIVAVVFAAAVSPAAIDLVTAAVFINENTTTSFYKSNKEPTPLQHEKTCSRTRVSELFIMTHTTTFSTSTSHGGWRAGWGAVYSQERTP